MRQRVTSCLCRSCDLKEAAAELSLTSLQAPEESCYCRAVTDLTATCCRCDNMSIMVVVFKQLADEYKNG